MAAKNNYCMNVIRAKHQRRKKSIPESIAYSISEAGYQAWLADGHSGSFEAFLESQSQIADKEYIIQQILTELSDMSVTELTGILKISGTEIS